MNGDLKNQRWRIEDLADFEYFRMKDEGTSGEALEVRDRAIFRDYGKADVGRRELFRYWLQRRRATQADGMRPGSIISPVFSIVAILLMLGGLCAGASAAWATLQYDGSVPVNVSVFWGVLIVPQIGLMIALFGLCFLGLVFPKSALMAYRFPTMLLMAISRVIWNLFLKSGRFSAERQDDVRWSAKVFSEIVGQHKEIAAAKVFGWVQRFGVFFNIGILLGSCALLMFTDRAFGWQSSLTDSPHTVSRIVKGIATPWRGFLDEGIGYPSMEQIEGSRIVLKDDPQSLDSGNLTSWWPFLLLGIVCYGLLPRLLGWAFAGYLNRRSLRSIRFHSFLHNPLWERMHSATLQSEGDKSTHSSTESDLPLSSDGAPMPGQFHVWISDGIRKRYPYEVLEGHLKESSRWNVLDFSECPDGESGPELSDGTHPLLLLEGWQPPIQEKLNQLKSLARSLKATEHALYLSLIGKPVKNGWRDMTPEMTEIWKKKIRLLGVDNLHLLNDPVKGAETE